MSNSRLKKNDMTSISFWIISISLLATTLFLLIEKNSINKKWQLSITISILITFIASIHYYSMRQWWDKYKKNPVFYRYIDWFLTVPLQIIEFYVILSISETVPSYLLVSLLTSSFLMILFGFLGETGRMNRNVAFTLGFVMWLYIIYEIFFGTGAQIESKTTNKNVKLAFNAMKWIVTIGWSIYPIGYMLNNKWMSVVYNFGDLINKILFVGVIWYAGSQDSK